MAQTTTTTGVDAVLTIDYEPILRNTINQMCPLFGIFRREGESKATRSKTTQFAVKTRQGNTARFYGRDDPAAFDTNSLENAPAYDTSQLVYKKLYAPYRVSHEVIREATREGAHFDVLEQDLQDMAQSFCHLIEWQIATSAGNGYLFTVATDPGTGAATAVDVDVENYGGWTGQELRILMENLNLEGQFVQFTSGTDAAPRDTGVAYEINSVDETAATSTINVSRVGAGNFAAAIAVGDFVRLSDSNYTTAALTTDAADSNLTPDLVGLPGLIDDYTNLTTFQDLTNATAPRFKSRVLANSGVNRPLTETLLQRAISIARVRQPGKNGDKPSMKRWYFVCHDFMRDEFALTLTADRRYTSPLLTRSGIKTYAGWDIEDVLTFDGVPFMCSQLAMRNSCFLVDTKNLVIVHNGPAEGQFLLDPSGGGKVSRIDGTPRFEYAWWAYLNMGARERSQCIRIDDLETIAGI